MNSTYKKSFTHPSVAALGVLALVLSYFIIQLCLIPHIALVRDELWFAHHIYQYTHHLPYRDFLPYKTVLGYYLLSIPMFFSHDVIAPLLYMKVEVAAINALLMLGIAYWARRFFNMKAILLTLLIIVFSQQFLLLSSAIRTDLLSSWLGLLSILLILSNRYSWAGLLLAAAFLFSQKALWLFIATDAALVSYWFFSSRNWKTILAAIKFNMVFIAIISIYLAFWSYQANVATVFSSVFYEAYSQSKLNWYESFYYLCWQGIILNGPLFFLLWPLTLIRLFVTYAEDKVSHQRVLIAVYAGVSLFLFAIYKQPFMYNTVFCLPAFFIIYSDFFSWLFYRLDERSNVPLALTKWRFNLLILVAIISIIAAIIIFQLPGIYYLTAFIPVFVFLLMTYEMIVVAPYQAAMWVVAFFIGIIYPLICLTYVLLSSLAIGGYQRDTIHMATTLLAEGGDYFAGTPLLYQRDQVIPGMKNLIGPQVDYFLSPSPALLPALLPSLYLSPTTTEEAINALQQQSVKLYVNNDRIEALPLAIRAQLANEFQHFWGSIYLYAPQIPVGQQRLTLKFSGNYRVESSDNNAITLDHQRVTINSIISLKQGLHDSSSRHAYRLVYIPNLSQLNFNSAFQQDDISLSAKV